MSGNELRSLERDRLRANKKHLSDKMTRQKTDSQVELPCRNFEACVRMGGKSKAICTCVLSENDIAQARHFNMVWNRFFRVRSVWWIDVSCSPEADVIIAANSSVIVINCYF